MFRKSVMSSVQIDARWRANLGSCKDNHADRGAYYIPWYLIPLSLYIYHLSLPKWLQTAKKTIYIYIR